MELSEITLLYPKLLSQLVQHPGIGLVIGREGDDVVVVGSQGELILNEHARVEGEDPLASLADGSTAANEIGRMARFPHSGDLVVFGSWDPTPPQQVTTFEDQVASHGGLGGEQMYPFIFYAPFYAPGDANSADSHQRRRLDPDQLTDATKLYEFFRREYHR
jgi:hypothetical protein